MPPAIVIVSGPIGSGKSTVARALATRLRTAGLRVATVDFDAVAGMLGGFALLGADASPLTEAVSPGWLEATRDVHGRLVRAWCDRGVNVVTDGPFHDSEAEAPLLRHLPAGIRPYRIRLLASYETALARVADDDRPRNLSLNPAFLRAAHDQFAEALPHAPPADWTIDTATVAPNETAAMVAQTLMDEPRR